MSAYVNDPRVVACSDGSFSVHVSPRAQAEVMFCGDFYLAFAPGRLFDAGVEFSTADEAIRSLIGDPR